MMWACAQLLSGGSQPWHPMPLAQLTFVREVTRMRKYSALTLLLLLVFAFCAVPADAQYAGSSSITNWNGNCGGNTRDWWDDMCMAWRHKMGDHGWVQWWRNYELSKATAMPTTA